VIARSPLNSDAKERPGIAMALAADREDTLTAFPYRATEVFAHDG